MFTSSVIYSCTSVAIVLESAMYNSNNNNNQLYFSRVALDSIKYCHLNLNEFYSIDSMYIMA